MNNNIYITIKKEIRSIIRDRKTIITLLLFPFIIPTMILLYAYIYDSQTEQKYYNIGLDYKPNTTETTILNNCYLTPKYYKTKQQMKKSYKKGKISGYIHYNKKKKKYTIYTNQKSSSGMYVSSYSTTYLDTYNTYLAKLKITEEDIDVNEVYNNFTYTQKSLKGENFILEIIFSMSFTFIIMSIVLSSTNMATSATAVEKENGTLETILTFPIKKSELLTGKYLATVLISIISSILGLMLTIITIKLSTSFFNILKTVPININIQTILTGILICISASLFVSGLAFLITSFTKTYKEAQSSSQILNIITIIPMMISMLNIKINAIYYLIPIVNYVQLLIDTFTNHYNYTNTLETIISSIIYVIITIHYIIKQYKTEKVLFST